MKPPVILWTDESLEHFELCVWVGGVGGGLLN